MSDPMEHLERLVCDVIAQVEQDFARPATKRACQILSELRRIIEDKEYWCPVCYIERDSDAAIHQLTETSSIYFREENDDGWCSPRHHGFLCQNCAKDRAAKAALAPLDRPLGDPPDHEAKGT